MKGKESVRLLHGPGGWHNLSSSLKSLKLNEGAILMRAKESKDEKYIEAWVKLLKVVECQTCRRNIQLSINIFKLAKNNGDLAVV